MAVRPHAVFMGLENTAAVELASKWTAFLRDNEFDFSKIACIDVAGAVPVVTDKAGNKFSIDFINNKKNYAKKKAGIKTELLAKAMGSGRYGMRVLDLSAGLGIDAVFLAQLGFEVHAVERDPLIFLALAHAVSSASELNLKISFGDSVDFSKQEADVIYFDPMFPDKAKSALPRQEMVFFKQLVGADDDAAAVLTAALKNRFAKRVVVKRPLKAPLLGDVKPQSQATGKLVRFDIYGVKP